jgi:hypothetical protein
MSSKLWQRLSKTGKLVIITAGTITTQTVIFGGFHFFSDSFDIKDIMPTIKPVERR